MSEEDERGEDDAGNDVGDGGGPAGADDSVKGESEGPVDEDGRERHVEDEARGCHRADEPGLAASGEVAAQNRRKRGEESIGE